MKNEDEATTAIEYETRKIPSVGLLGIAVGAMALSAMLMLVLGERRKHWALFFGQWVPSILVMGTYNKIAKTFSPPFDEAQREKHGDNAMPKPISSPEAFAPAH